MPDNSTPAQTLSHALRELVLFAKRPQYWAYIAGSSGLDIDRPAAQLLLSISRGPKEGAHPLAIANGLGIEAPSVTRKSQELERQGYLERVPDDKDRRSVRLVLTDKGLGAVASIKKAYADTVESAINDWGSEDREEFIRLFTKFVSDYKKGEKPNA